MSNPIGRYIVSTCGTSLLTYNKSKDDREFIYSTANCAEEKLSPEDKSKIDRFVEEGKEELIKASSAKKRKMSAEMNGLIGLFEKEERQKNDICRFLHTDTYQGSETARVISSVVQEQMNVKNCEAIKVQDLNMSNFQQFNLGLSELAKRLPEECTGYHEKGYKVIFNLVGGFKTFQGFMQIIGMLYADLSVYIFEGENSPILEIPSLPLQLNDDCWKDIFEKNLTFFRELSWNNKYTSKPDDNIPDILLMNIEEEWSLSPWGEIVWGNFKKKHYGDKLFESPSANISFTPNFYKKAEKFDRERKFTLNERIDDLDRYLNTPNTSNLKRLDFKELKTKIKAPSTHEFDVWSDRGAWRCFCHFDEKVLVIDDIGPGLH